MKTESYADFHRPAYRDVRWLETHWFGFFVPEAGIRGHLRAAFRTNLDVAFSLVAIYSQSGGVLDADFYDSQMHVPIGTARLSDFALASGLSMRGHPAPDRYSVGFHSRCGRVSVEMECEALMRPLESSEQHVGSASVAGFGAFHQPSRSDVPVGHVDQTFRVLGSLRIDDDHYEIDCISNHDHSWSPRAEWKSRCGTFDNFHFGTDLTLSTQAVENSWNKAEVTHGYVLRGAELRSIRDISVTYVRSGLRTTAVRYELTDAEGEEYEIEGLTRAAIEQDQGSNGYTVMNLCDARWNGTDGYGECMWHWDVPGELQRRVRQARKLDPNASIDSIFNGR